MGNTCFLILKEPLHIQKNKTDVIASTQVKKKKQCLYPFSICSLLHCIYKYRHAVIQVLPKNGIR